MTQIRNAVCPVCAAEVSVTYWPLNTPLYTVHTVRGTNRDCGQSLRPVVIRSDSNTPRPAP